MRRKATKDSIPNGMLAFDIGLRHRRQICLGRNRKVAVEVGATDLGSRFCRVQRRAQKLRFLVTIHARNYGG